jgi:hypothetical protein
MPISKRSILAVIFIFALVFSSVAFAHERTSNGASTSASNAGEKSSPKSKPYLSGQEITAFVNKVWHKKRWQKTVPNARASTTYKKILVNHPQRSVTIKKKWKEAQKSYLKHKKQMTWWHKITPFKGGGRRWAIPYYIVVCESGARLFSSAAPSGAYGLIEATWQQFRSKKASKYSMPYLAPKIEQDRVAHILWTRYGGSPWTCS